MRKLRRNSKKQVKPRKTKKVILNSATAVLAVGSGLTLTAKTQASPNDPHQLPLTQDSDGDLLTDAEEFALNFIPTIPDQNQNGILDGVELAQQCAALINALPWEHESPPPDATYRWHQPAFGMETCAICGATVNMGSAGIVNPKLNLEISYPLIVLHYMEHGSFSYDGNVHGQGRIDIPLLIQILEVDYLPPGDSHQFPVKNDTDCDMINNREEQAVGYLPFHPDQNQNDILDGEELAQRLAAAVLALPKTVQSDQIYKLEHALDGLERCGVCGQWIHMGGWEIHNPMLKLQYPDPDINDWPMFLPDIALHYMEHGAFDFLGSTNIGRVDIPRLMRVLEIRHPITPDNHQFSLDPNDLDGDLITDNEEIKAQLNLYHPDQNQNLIPDGPELARQCLEIIEKLPPYQDGITQTCRQDNELRGLENCDICGAPVNMGMVKIINPNLHLEIELPYIALHYFAHGGLTYAGDVHGKNRVSLPLLMQILDIPQRCGHLGTDYLPQDVNRDCKINLTDFAELAQRWLQSTDPASDPGE